MTRGHQIGQENGHARGDQLFRGSPEPYNLRRNRSVGEPWYAAATIERHHHHKAFLFGVRWRSTEESRPPSFSLYRSIFPSLTLHGGCGFAKMGDGRRWCDRRWIAGGAAGEGTWGWPELSAEEPAPNFISLRLSLLCTHMCVF
jgi:hypothetical protein